MDDEVIVLFMRGLYHYLGKSVSEAYKQSRADYLRANTKWRCSICGKRTKKTGNMGKTIDHIIPKNIIFETGLVGLLFDHRNFRLTHALCNVQRGELTIDDLPDKVRDKLFGLLKDKYAH